MARAKVALVAFAVAMAGCLPAPPGQTVAPPSESPEAPAPVSIVDEAALAWGPPLVLDEATLESEDDVLSKLQEALADLEAAKARNEELAARLKVESQKRAALQAELDDLQARLAQTEQQLKLKADRLKKTEADLQAAMATISQLRTTADKNAKKAAEAAKLASLLKQANAENQKLRDKVLQAELARVKAEQDLIALQIVMARQQALLKRRPGPQAKAPGTTKEATR